MKNLAKILIFLSVHLFSMQRAPEIKEGDFMHLTEHINSRPTRINSPLAHINKSLNAAYLLIKNDERLVSFLKTNTTPAKDLVDSKLPEIEEVLKLLNLNGTPIESLRVVEEICLRTLKVVFWLGWEEYFEACHLPEKEQQDYFEKVFAQVEKK